MNKTWTILAAALLISGCTLPEVPNRGDKCPPIDAEYESYLGLIGNVLCSETACDESEEDYSENIATGFCPVEYPECGYDVQAEMYYCAKIACKINEHVYDNECEKDTTRHCGSHENKCSDLAGWEAGSCKNKRCVASECKDNYILVEGKCEAHSTECSEGEHYYVEGMTCENNTIANCGSHGHNCENLSGWGNGVCSTDGKCIALSCTAGYTLDEDNRCIARTDCPENEHLYEGECEADSVENCGNHGNSCTRLSGWVDGTCIEGNCQPSLCDTGYELKTDKCEALIDCQGDEHLFSGECEPNDIEHCGSHNNSCLTMAGWLNGSCDFGVCNPTQCLSGYVIDGNKCVALECSSGQHVNSTGSACENDTVNDCGMSGYSCAANVPGWGGGTCSNAKCVPNKCQSGYCLNKDNQCVNGDADKNACGTTGGKCTTCTGTKICYAGSCQESKCDANQHLYNGTCESDTTANCGKHGNTCNLLNAIDHKCDSGVCKATRCADSYHLYAGTCEKNDLNNCGSHNRTCAIDNATTLDCASGSCKVTACSSRYHVYSNKCEINDLDNCGEHGKTCSTTSIKTHVSCTTGTCRATTCSTPYYHLYDGTCEPNSNSNCKYHNVTCSTDQFLNSTAVSCSDGVCKPSVCKAGYHPYQNKCETDDINNCGSHDKKCSIANSSLVSCENKTCILKTCATGYHKNGNTCELNSINNCGAHDKKCTTASVTNSSAVECSKYGSCKATECKPYALLTSTGACTKKCDTDKTYCSSKSKCCSSSLCFFSCTDPL